VYTTSILINVDSSATVTQAGEVSVGHPARGKTIVLNIHNDMKGSGNIVT